MPILNQLSSPRDYWDQIVLPDYQEFLADDNDLRRALRLSVSLFHMADWIYQANKATINASFIFQNSNGIASTVRNEKNFANSIRDINADFEIVRRIANSAKHLALSGQSTNPDAPSHASDVTSRSTGWGDGGWGQGPWGGSPRIVVQAPSGQLLEFSVMVESVKNTWETLNGKHNWF